MRKIEISELKENFFETIGKEWMLITAGQEKSFNTMTASWGGIGWLWNRPVVFVFIRPERYTYQFTEKNDFFTLSFLGFDNQARNTYILCGTKSGREIDKIKETGLKPLITENGNITFEQARLTLECRKLYVNDMNTDSFLEKSILDKWYGGNHGNLHHIYIAEIISAWTNE